MKTHFSAPVRAWLQAWSRLPEYARRKAEHAAVASYRKKYTAVAYMTGDAVVTVGDHVLLVRRKGPFGEDLWAVPGGHLDRGEKLVACAIRELIEETRFPLLPASILAALHGVATFEDPLRSARGRLITMAHHFKFPAMGTLPEVVVSSAGGEVSGRVTGPIRGREGALVLVFPTDSSRWYHESRFLKLVPAAPDAGFTVTGLPPGEYHIVAMDAGALDPFSDEWRNPALLAALATSARRVTVGEGSRVSVELRRSPAPR